MEKGFLFSSTAHRWVLQLFWLRFNTLVELLAHICTVSCRVTVCKEMAPTKDSQEPYMLVSIRIGKIHNKSAKCVRVESV